MSAKQSQEFRPQLQALEDRLVMSTVHHGPALHHVVRNTLTPYIFNPMANPPGITVHGLPFAGTSNPPVNGGGFFPPGINFANFFPASIFAQQASAPGAQR